jgi:hypothetical protein
MSPTFAHEAQLPWTGFSKTRGMSALEILQCIWAWPEAILGELDSFCDVTP